MVHQHIIGATVRNSARVALKDLICIGIVFVIWNYWKEIVSLYWSVKTFSLSFIQRLKDITGTAAYKANSTEELKSSRNNSG